MNVERRWEFTESRKLSRDVLNPSDTFSLNRNFVNHWYMINEEYVIVHRLLGF